MFTPPVYSFAGSSPLTRGKLDPQSDQRNAHGLIPAHAGKTLRALARVKRLRAHPRSHGENVWAPLQGRRGKTSSPLTRGKPWGRVPHHCPRRLIPAHTGKTRLIASARSLCGAHPRSRGENQVNLVLDDGMQGSSPLTRGKPAAQRLSDLRERLIPAHAGKTRPGFGSSIICPGSSPLTRGKL